MSSGFISGGTTDAPIERDDKWLAVQLEIEKERQERKDKEKAAAEGKSLFETLEANKAAKQEAFEEANRLKNQFRALDDDEIEFLDELRGREREEEARVRKETAEGLDAFRKHREEMEKKEREKEAQYDVVEEVKEDEWKVGRKRKATKEKTGGLGIKLRKVSSVEATEEGEKTDRVKDKARSNEAGSTIGDSEKGQKCKTKAASSPKTNGDGKVEDTASKSDGLEDESICAGNLKDDATSELQPTAKSGLGLVSYGSDEDDEW